MLNSHPYVIYNASAGSGKTYTLVKSYLSILLQAKSPLAFKNILAITFTNKAADEMKTRIIKALRTFSSDADTAEKDNMFQALSEELEISKSTIKQKSKRILNTILHNYAAFDISTIDGFTHRLIRTFAHDLKLPLNFEVELDTESLLHEAVDKLISKAGTNKQLTKTLIDFAIEKADDDKSWDVSHDFYDISKLLTQENDRPFIKTLEDKTHNDFKALKINLRNKLKTTERDTKDSANMALNFIIDNGLAFECFLRESIPNYFKKVSEGNFNIDTDKPKWPTDLIEGNTIYTKSKTNAETVAIIESIQPKLAELFLITKKATTHLTLLKAIYRNLTPLSVLQAINKELQSLKAEKNVLLISEFNALISQEIKDQPTPFIYERMGEKFKHYFIDEFQDTSILQWQNLTPLLDSTLASKPGSILLVGDAKQAIYRWRGGEAEQFISLYNKTNNPFQTTPKIRPLKSNFRSQKAIIEFNNAFFKYISETIFSKTDYSELYKKSHQQIEKEESGYVSLSFLDFSVIDNKDLAYAESVYDTAQSCLENNFSEADICVLVRTKKQGVAIANYLSEKGMHIMSSETLLLQNSKNVQFINALLAYLKNPENQDIKANVLLHITRLCNMTEKHAFLETHIGLDSSAFFQAFEKLGFQIDYKDLLQLSFFDLIETLIREFKLVAKSDAYIQYYMDVALEFSEKKLADIASFLEFFETKKETLSIITPEGYQAIQIMTIHKSKGLEFPVVIFPFAEMNIYKEVNPQEWFPLNPDEFSGFQYSLLNYNKSFENYGEVGKTIFNKHKAALELDTINVLYVALTRAAEQLYIISKLDINSKNEINDKTYAGFFIKYLQHAGYWENNTLDYSFGIKAKKTEPNKTEDFTRTQNEFISTTKEAHNIKIMTRAGSLWDTAQEKAIEKGNLIHDIMAEIKTEHDIKNVINTCIEDGTISNNQVPYLEETVINLIKHEKLQPYFSEENQSIYNERDIISNDGRILRPDRLVINSQNQVVIIDYKSGKEQVKHLHQLNDYEAILKDMGFQVSKKILIYINDGIDVKEF